MNGRHLLLQTPPDMYGRITPPLHTYTDLNEFMDELSFCDVIYIFFFNFELMHNNLVLNCVFKIYISNFKPNGLLCLPFLAE